MDKKSSVYEETTEAIVAKKFFHINKQTLPLKTTLFLYYGAMAALLPYLTIHMQDIGISIQETAIIYGILPFTSFLGPPILGFLADKLGQYKIVLIISIVANGLFHSLLLIVPAYKEHSVINTRTAILHWKNTTDLAYLKPADPVFCDSFVNNLTDATELNIEISNCIPYFAGKDLEDNAPCFTENNKRNIDLHCYKSLSNENNNYGHGDLNESFGTNTIEDAISTSCGLNASFPSASNITSFLCQTNVYFPTENMITVGNNSVTFWCYFIFRILATVFTSACFSLMDATTIAVVKKNAKSEYGKERIWAIVGAAIMSPIAGVLVDTVSRYKGYTDYSSAFYVANVLLTLNIVFFFVLNLEVEKPEDGFGKNGAKLLKYPEVNVFVVMIFFLGSIWGFVESYLFIFLKELNAPNYLLGLTLTVGSLTGIPFLYGAERILLKFGRVNLIVLAFLTYFVRFFGYSYIWNPFWCFPFEAMEAFTYHLMWVAAATYCGVLAPKGLLATLMGIVGSLHYSLGKGNGSFIGGYLLGAVGSRLSFRYFGIASGIFGVLYFVLHEVWLKKVIDRRLASEGNAEGDDKKVKDELLGKEFKTLTLNDVRNSYIDEEKAPV